MDRCYSVSLNAEALTGAMVMSRPGLQLGNMFESVVLLHPGSVLMSEVPVTIDGHMNIQDLGLC